MNGELICLDTCILIDWARDRNGKNSEKTRAMESMLESAQSGACRLCASTLVYPEILESKMSVAEMKKFHKFIGESEKMKIIPVDTGIAKKAQEIRSRYPKKTKKEKTIETPDAVHLATAIALEAKVFHTDDRKLLALDGKDFVDGLRITKCV
ncbi:MAG: PIN domain-containing protein [Gammaproteobacteria bacterium]|nr:PIN domain-containing protein [Gammaproteobacteria bacterium]MDA7971653.1 PIN domain-containing protein [Gammaproteobacteria bacterium]MDA8024042.1 PIN domain-containing protein [Gammaproteobacteria bacterium]CAJ2376631.1 MAG: hypothetical protein IBGAMO2_400004 [Arenicellales bacterium IbO2]